MSNDINRRTFLEATGGVASMVALAGNSGASDAAENVDGEDDVEDVQQETDETVLNLINETMTSFDPVQAEDTASGWVTYQLYDGLVKYPNGGIPVEENIAAGYEVSDDFTTYTFTLKEGVTFHDGREVTAADFEYTHERLAVSENSTQSFDILDTFGIVHETDEEDNYEPGSMATEVVDDYTYRMEIQAPFHSALQVLANNQFAVIPEGVLGDVPGYDGEMSVSEFATETPIGAGPFELDEWVEGTEASVTAFDDYHGEGPLVDRIHWQVIEDDSAAYNYAMNQNADVFEIPTAQYDPANRSEERRDDTGRRFGTYGPLRNGETVEFVGVPTLSIQYIGFNMETVPKPVRQAVAYALDQQIVAEQFLKGRAVPAYHFTAPSLYPGGADAYDQHAEEAYPYGYNEQRIDDARNVMEEAGYSSDDPYELELLSLQDESWIETGQLLRDALASAHVDMTIDQAPFSTLLNRVENMNVEAYTLGWVVPWAAPDAFTKHLRPDLSDPSTQPDAEAFNKWPNDTDAAQRGIEAWQRIDENREPTDEAQEVRNEAYIEMEEANWEDVANLPVYHPITQQFWYDWVDIPPFGAGGNFKRKLNTVEINR